VYIDRGIQERGEGEERERELVPLLSIEGLPQRENVSTVDEKEVLMSQ
jgi:hypothetical protein